MIAAIRPLLRLLTVALLALPLASCYIPDKFKGELRLSRYGDYALTYQGDLIYAPIMHDYAGGRITPENEQEKNDNIYKDLVRDPAIKDIQRVGKGRFRVKFERQGRLGKVQLSSFLRRDARLLSLKSNEDGSIIIDANGVKSGDAQRMAELGIGMEGEFRITTDANVVRHNATEVRPYGQYKVYIWKIENALSATPTLVMLRDPDPNRPL
ncbi:hypothetical protein [Magnetospirillum gryphiswaldense]|uniref:Uncharacterized protein n=2 Tax=Magnetospirillum gryphiswaldense TaxID=55518 RepID=V6EYT1_MAGGM|nr:hypothetical protein [Magnetospirillum gryphiswaldense]AVM73619.1 hypothetical protein MSR1_11210 [Magnetospirillum gryphiswaldense MSR-1]AVM77522.1 hypothetical protein MSR1L_11210 [Magnetospirillum gryphiswaldense]CAM76070.1 conserved hypothetical protein [Magnetospirillum gryphiswaldense MSR-1]CDK98354.1 conserved protein of unknown function [Magnetospirillum gryphiswaldense MSR-1 v2]